MSAAPGMPRSLAEIAAGFCAVPAGIDVVDVTLASGEVQPGGAFLACRGRTTHGLAHVRDAIARGARAVLWEPAEKLEVPDFPSGIYAAPVPGLSRHAGEIAHRFFGEPSSALDVIGVTGTNGKTTTAWLVAQALTACGRDVRYSGTLGHGRPGALRTGTHTTPDAVSVHRQLAALRAEGAGAVALEVSSHALDQDRVGGVRFATAMFTNLTREHLDYHGTMQAYGAAKARLFEHRSLVLRVINVDDAFGAALAARNGAPGKLVTVSRKRPASVAAVRVAPTARGLELDVHSEWGELSLGVGLVGEFNADNALAALALLLAWGIDAERAAAALGTCTAPPGRMEMFGGRAGRPLAIVDYAHTPDALEKALEAVRGHVRGRLAVVFGCGGERDPGKRPLMGAVAAARADLVVITNDNPRGEDPAAITAAILAGTGTGTGTAAATGAGTAGEGAAAGRIRVEHDRAAAIASALATLGPDDAVLVAGKGHEDYQIVGTQRLAFSDQAVVRELLGEAA